MLGSRCPICSLHWPRPRLPHPHPFQVDKFETDVFTPGALSIRVSFVLFWRLVHLLLSFPTSVFSFLSKAFLKTSVCLPECQWKKMEQACAKHSENSRQQRETAQCNHHGGLAFSARLPKQLTVYSGSFQDRTCFGSHLHNTPFHRKTD